METPTPPPVPTSQERAAAEAAVRQQSGEFFHSYRTMVQVNYAELRKAGILDAWLLLRGQAEAVGEYDWVTIGQAALLGLIEGL